MRLTVDFRELRQAGSMSDRSWRRILSGGSCNAACPNQSLDVGCCDSSCCWRRVWLVRFRMGDPLVAAPSPVMFAQAADTSTAAGPGGSNGDEMPNTSQRPAASTGGDEVPTALAPANPEPSSAAAQSATSSSGDEVPSPAVVPEAVGALPSKSSAGAPGEETPTSPANWPAPAAPAAAPAPAIAGADAPIADRLREALKGDTARVALEPFYSARNYAPLWITDGKVNERAWAATPTLRASTPTVSSRPIIRCRILPL